MIRQRIVEERDRAPRMALVARSAANGRRRARWFHHLRARVRRRNHRGEELRSMSRWPGGTTRDTGDDATVNACVDAEG
jgi:hypothetical protein